MNEIKNMEEDLKIINKKYSTNILMFTVDNSPSGESIELETSDTIVSKEYDELTNLMNKNNYHLKEFYSYNSDDFICNIYFVYKTENIINFKRAEE